MSTKKHSLSLPLQPIGRSLGVTIPKRALVKSGLEKGDWIMITLTEKKPSE